MRVGLNMLFVAAGLAGGRIYCEGLLRGLAAVDQENEYVVYTRDVAVFQVIGDEHDVITRSAGLPEPSGLRRRPRHRIA